MEQQPPSKLTSEKKSESFRLKKNGGTIFSWKITEEDLKNQINNYNTLKITESYRGISILITLSLLGLSLILGFFDFLSLEDILLSLIIYLPILLFVYKGHRWAILALMILWTIEKGIQLFTVGNITPLFWWAIIIPYFYKALKVENARKKQKAANAVPPVSNKLNRYCRNCGKALAQSTTFCPYCGFKLD
jgi:hypothetical protein